jgi:hypothetical protein
MGDTSLLRIEDLIINFIVNYHSILYVLKNFDKPVNLLARSMGCYYVFSLDYAAYCGEWDEAKGADAGIA